ncbi:unnamed protein product [Trichobilharzia regenti]|uniref:CDT1 domain-containing protein n=1 Tax=Trichobilharzia regenti TaxID=157069 RepID=A0A183W155_TRIRE|nr:unnamed protein product [Trichobilharzia regenti]VDQ02343.1 unnamed protein product [Trichobilharzia regenti]
MSDLILFRRPRRAVDTASPDHCRIYRSEKLTVTSNRKYPSLKGNQNTARYINISTMNTKPSSFMNPYKYWSHRSSKRPIDNVYNPLSLKGNILNKDDCYNNDDIQCPIETCNQLHVSKHTQRAHDFECLKSDPVDASTTTTTTEIDFTDILQKIPPPMKRTPLYHDLIKIARELRNVLLPTFEADITCSIKKLPKNYQESSVGHQNNYAIILKEKLTDNEIILSE